MLKSVSSITNAIGALNFKGTWNASTNTPTLASGVGTKGDYYVVSVAGSTTLDGISNWGVGDWATYNGVVWQRVEGGADLNGVNLTASGTSLLSGNTGVGGDTTGVVDGVTVTSKFCVKNEGANPVAGFVHVNNTTAGSGSGTFACRSRGTLAVPTVVQNNDSLWNMYIAGNDGTDLALAAQISVEVDGTPGSNDMPGRMVFLTTPDGSQTPTEAMRISSAQNVTVAGNILAGTTTNTNSARIISNGLLQTLSLLATSGHGRFQGADSSPTGASGVGLELYVSATTNAVVQAFNRTTSAFSPLTLACSTLTSEAAYNNTVGGTNRDVFVDNTGLIGYVSSVRASKKNINSISDVSWLMELEPVTFNYRKKDAEGQFIDEAYSEIEYGLIAEDVEAVNKELCFYDETENGSELRGISYSKLIVPLLAKIQELEMRLNKLEVK